MKTLANNSFINALRKPMALFMVLCLLNGQFLLALDPTGVSGVTQNGNEWTVDLNQSGSIIQWNNLDTNPNELLKFTGNPTRVLNRVHQKVLFNGDLWAPGKQVYILSPNGVHIGDGSMITASKFVASGLDIANDNFLFENDVFQPFNVGDGMKMIGQVQNDGTIQTLDKDMNPIAGNVYLLGSKVLNNGTISSEGGLVVLATTTGTGEDTGIIIGDGSNIVIQTSFSADGLSYNTGLGLGDVKNTGKIESPAGQIVLAAGDTFAQALENLAPAMVLSKVGETKPKLDQVRDGLDDDLINGVDTLGVSIVSDSSGNLDQHGELNTGTSAGVIAMQGDITTLHQGSVTKSSEINIGSNENVAIGIMNEAIDPKTELTSGSDMTIVAFADDVDTQEDFAINVGKDLTVVSGNFISLREATEINNGNIILDANRSISLSDHLRSNNGSILLSTDTIAQSDTDAEGFAVTAGDIIAEGDVKLETGIGLIASKDQTIKSNSGTVTAMGLVLKTDTGHELLISGGNPDTSVDLHATVDNGGNIYIKGIGTGQIQISGDISAIGDEYEGGVSIISGSRIFTKGPDTNTLDIHIEGSSNFDNGTGVDLPFGNGKAAIVLKSNETLVLGPNAELHASGGYVAADPGDPYALGTDDRPGADLLETDGTVIGGYERDPGDPMDIAIYVGSETGNVEVNPDAISVENYLSAQNTGGDLDGKATVVLDAGDTVEFPGFDGSGEGGFSLEVVSRITEWLSQAIQNGRLPFADSKETVEAMLGDGYDYVLRGAGQDNPEIANTDETRAWVLEDMPDEDIVVPVAPLASLEIPELKGCPVEMDAAASELAMNSDDLQLLIGNSLATNPNLQPCEACQKLVTAAAILNDADGARMAAMNEIFNTLAPIDAPFTPEISASIATAFANLSTDDLQYAQKSMAKEYIDAFVDYVAVIGTDLKAPVGDPVAFTLQKHGDAITGSENPNIAAYIMAQVQATEGAI